MAVGEYTAATAAPGNGWPLSSRPARKRVPGAVFSVPVRAVVVGGACEDRGHATWDLGRCRGDAEEGLRLRARLAGVVPQRPKPRGRVGRARRLRGAIRA